MPFIARLLAQLLAFFERFAFGKWLMWMFDMLLAGATWMFRGFGQMLVAFGLFAGAQQALPAIKQAIDPPRQTISQKYGVMVSRAEAVAIGAIMAKEKFPVGSSVYDLADTRSNPVIWTANNREFWVVKSLWINAKSYVDESNHPLKEYCYKAYVYPAEKVQGQYVSPQKTFFKGGGDSGTWAWPPVVEECRLEGKSSFRYWWG